MPAFERTFFSLTALLAALVPACSGPRTTSRAPADVPPRDAASTASRNENWTVAAEQWSLVALEDGQDCVQACLEAAEAFRRLDDIESAQGILELGLARHPDDPALHEALGDVLVDMGFSRAAERSYEQALSLDPERTQVCLKLGRLRLELGLETSALAALDRVVAKGKACPETWYLRGAACQARGDLQGAFDSYHTSFSQGDPDPVRQLAAARLFFDGPGQRVRGARETAREWLADVVQEDPQCSEGFFMLGELERESGQNERAVEELRRAVEIDPASFRYVEALSEAYMEVGDRENAQKMIERARALDAPRSKRLERLFEDLAAR